MDNQNPKSKIQNPKSAQSIVQRLARAALSLRWKALPPDYDRTYRFVQTFKRSNVQTLEITVLPSVFHPKWHFTSLFLAEQCAKLVQTFKRSNVQTLEIGTGTGVVAIAAARHAARVVAVDVNPTAVKCAKLNAVSNGMAGKVEVYEGDMFDPIQGVKFDLILCNPPYFRGEPRTEAELAYMGGPNLEWISRLAREAHSYLHPNGSMACVFGDAADVPELVTLIEKEGWQGQIFAKRNLLTETLTIWQFKVES